MDTPNRRASAIMVSLPFRGLLPLPDGQITADDRAQVAFMYAAISLGITSTDVLQKPVDYALAGQQTRPGRIAGRALRHVFDE